MQRAICTLYSRRSEDRRKKTCTPLEGSYTLQGVRAKSSLCQKIVFSDCWNVICRFRLTPRGNGAPPSLFFLSKNIASSVTHSGFCHTDLLCASVGEHAHLKFLQCVCCSFPCCSFRLSSLLQFFHSCLMVCIVGGVFC